MNVHTLARIFGWIRVAFGLALLAAPGPAVRMIAGPVANEPGGAQVLARGLGGRDLAVGAGLLVAMRSTQPLAAWLGAGVLSDGGDAAAILLAFPYLPAETGWRALAAALVGTGFGLYLLVRLR